MSRRTVATHVATVAVTGLAVWAWMAGRPSAGRSRAEFEAARPVAEPRSATVAIAPVEPPAIPEEALRLADADERVNISVYAATNRGVVNITTATVTPGFFDDVVSSGSGSGFVIDRKGHILTNYHVIEGAQAVQVTLFDGSTHEAAVIGTDPSTDLAVVQVDAPADRLFPLRLGDSTRLLVGQKVLAVGNPFGLERTLTTGIISALDRSIKARNQRTIKGIIQTDASINPGNSGGPLLNTRGEVIGMNTAILSQVGQSAGIGFAVPIAAIQRILPQLLERGFVVRADLGITRVLKTDEGLLIVSLAEGGPAQRAGLRPVRLRVERLNAFTIRRRLDVDAADIIVGIEGKPVRTVDDLLQEVEAHPPGTMVAVEILRGGRRQSVKVRLGESVPE